MGFRSNTSDRNASPPSTCSAEDSRVRTYPRRAKVLAWLVLEAACGASLRVLSHSFGHCGSWWKMWRQRRTGGLMPCVQAWEHSGTRAYRSRLRRVISARPICDDGSSSLLPTPTHASYGTSGNGDPGDGRGEYAHAGTPSLNTMARQGLLPTPLACRGGARAKWEDAKETNIRGARLENVLLYPTPTAGDAKASGSGLAEGSSANPGVSLTDVVVHGRSLRDGQHGPRIPDADQAGGRHLSPRFVEWMMGLPLGWTDPDSEL